MSYVVSARKYRPKTFEEVVGQEHVTSTLVNALKSDKLAHAFLFCGPRGVGKTTCARLLAKLVNMPDPKKAILDGSYATADIDISLNIIELDAASNNSVEHIRTLTEQVRFQPQ
jgi:DNA polymerase-3 subunit gamma/tau